MAGSSLKKSGNKKEMNKMKENRIQLRTIRQRPGLSNFVLPFIDALLESGRTELSGPSVTEDPVACIVSQARAVMDADDWLLAWNLLQAEQEGQLPYA